MQEPQEQAQGPIGPASGRPISPDEQDALETLGQHMGNPLDQFDMDVVKKIQELDREEEASRKKMHAAQTGGAGPGLGPEEEAQLLAKQQQTLQQKAAVQGQQAAQAAQAQQTSPTPPPAPTGSVGVSQPYPAQAGPQPPPAPAPEEQQ